jgi:alpha-amylase
MTVVVDPDAGGSVTEWSLLDWRINLVDTLTRRPEPYHAKLRAGHVAAAAAGHAPASIHDSLGAKEDNLESYLIYDDHRRTAFHDYGFPAMPDVAQIVRSAWAEPCLWQGGAYRPGPRSAGGRGADAALERPVGQGMLRKRVRLDADQPAMECVYAVEGVEAPVVALEFNLSVRDERYLAAPGELPTAGRFELAEPGLRLQLALDQPARIVHFPIETVSESEEGLERIYQGLAVLCFWEVPPGRPWSVRARWTAAGTPA